jgi:hypothetical protein
VQEREPAALVAPAGRLLLAELGEFGRRGRRVAVAVAVSCFVPRPVAARAAREFRRMRPARPSLPVVC